MKKMLAILGATLIALLILLLAITSQSGLGAGSTLTAGTYIYGQDIAAKGYMYQLEGPGEVVITTPEGEEAYYKELKEGESVHEHFLPLEEGDSLTISGEAQVELI